jgi:hypothetical protein
MLRAYTSCRGFLGISYQSANDQLILSKSTVHDELFLSFGSGAGPIVDVTAREMRT